MAPARPCRASRSRDGRPWSPCPCTTPPHVRSCGSSRRAGSYNATTHTDQDGCVTVSIKDTVGRPVATATLLDDSTQAWLYNLEFTGYSATGVQRSVRVPNYYAPPQGSDAAAWVNVTQ